MPAIRGKRHHGSTKATRLIKEDFRHPPAQQAWGHGYGKIIPVEETINRTRDEQDPVLRATRLLERKWVLLIVRDLSQGAKRFTALQKSLHINPRTLSQRLADLEKEGIVERRSFAGVPPRVEYSLKEKGKALLPVLEKIRIFGQAWY
jgi:DNA-binding HxlR family transcriptional regulator